MTEHNVPNTTRFPANSWSPPICSAIAKEEIDTDDSQPKNHKFSIGPPTAYLILFIIVLNIMLLIAIFSSYLHTLYVTCKNPIEVMSWTETFHRLEKCCDTCEHAANVVEGVIMKNT